MMPDPYRWLEDDSPESWVWLAAQRQRARDYLANLPGRERIAQRLTSLVPPSTSATADASAAAGGKDAPAAWTPGGEGFFYDRYWPWPGLHALYYHVAGAPQAQDQPIYQRPEHPDWHYAPQVSEDGRYLVIAVLQGSDIRNLLLVQDLAQPGAPPVELVSTFEARYDFVGNAGPRFWLRAEEATAPNGRIVAVDLRQPDRSNWREIVPETTRPLRAAWLLNRQLVASYLENACSRLVTFDLDGQTAQEIALPGHGTVTDVDADAGQSLTYTYIDFLTPPTLYRYDALTGASHPCEAGGRSPGFDPAAYETRQVWYASRDGTPVSMFLCHTRGLRLDGANPTYLYVYGGFDTALTPQFSAEALAWMELGGVYAVANLRGGGEYGSRCRQAAIQRNKHKTFDDCIAAAEWLIANRVTNPARLALGGASNGGLTAGACLVQRPDLFGAVIIQAGVLDMLRFDHLGVGADWVCEYGSPGDPADREALAAYSPLHNVRAGAAYPPTLITTAERDERVGAAHSFKFAAALQAAQAGSMSILLHVTDGNGHGECASGDQFIAEATGRLAFLAQALGMEVGT